MKITKFLTSTYNRNDEIYDLQVFQVYQIFIIVSHDEAVT